VVERIRKIESDHEELRRQIIKAFENLSAHPLKELDSLKERLLAVEKRTAVSPRPAVRPPAAPGRVTPPLPARAKQGPAAWVEKLPQLPRGRVLSLAALFLLAAGVLGAAMAWRWSDSNGGGAHASAGPPPASDLAAPNVVYDNLDLGLESPTLYIGAEQMALDDGKADIGGYAPGAVRAWLYVNGQETASVEVSDREFNFPAVSFEYGRNVVEVLTADEAGNKANSLARIIDRMSQKAAKVRAQDVINRMRGPREVPHLALTIDAGSSNKRAVMVLDALQAKGIVTTFFLTGQFIERYPDLARRIVADGHEVGAHTYSHPHLTTFEQNRHHQTSPGMTREKFQSELIRTRDLFESVTGAKMSHWWRAPYGEYNDTILGWAHEVGFDHIDWTRSPKNHDMLDWVADTRSPYYLDSTALLQRLVGIHSAAIRANGGIILVHLGTDRDRDFLDLVLPRAIDELRSKGYEFVTISRMFSD
jgi:peptidoglycan/xylan/chitin deacetylase (PgdA/CDA1 family)